MRLVYYACRSTHPETGVGDFGVHRLAQVKVASVHGLLREGFDERIHRPSFQVGHYGAAVSIGILQLSPAGEVSPSSPRGRGGITVHDGRRPGLARRAIQYQIRIVLFPFCSVYSSSAFPYYYYYFFFNFRLSIKTL